MHDQKTSIQVENPCSARPDRGLERMTGIEPAFSAWEARLTVLSYPPDITTESVYGLLLYESIATPKSKVVVASAAPPRRASRFLKLSESLT